MAQGTRPAVSDADFLNAIMHGDAQLESLPGPTDPLARAEAVALAQVHYTKALALAMWRAAGRLYLIESAQLETDDEMQLHERTGQSAHGGGRIDIHERRSGDERREAG